MEVQKSNCLKVENHVDYGSIACRIGKDRLRAQTPDLEAQAKEAMLVELYRQNKLSHTRAVSISRIGPPRNRGGSQTTFGHGRLADRRRIQRSAGAWACDKVIVVSDTTPLNYLLLIDAIDVLPALFEQVYVPPSVIVEMTRLKTPNVVRQWGKSLPADLPVPLPIARGLSSVTLRSRSASAPGVRRPLLSEPIQLEQRYSESANGKTLPRLLAICQDATSWAVFIPAR